MDQRMSHHQPPLTLIFGVSKYMTISSFLRKLQTIPDHHALADLCGISILSGNDCRYISNLKTFHDYYD